MIVHIRYADLETNRSVEICGVHFGAILTRMEALQEWSMILDRELKRTEKHKKHP